MERRLAAILAADVVGYTRLMGMDEVGTLQRLTELRGGTLEPLIDEHGGRIVKLMGDGLLVEFASVVNSIACAISWQEAAANFQSGGDLAGKIQFRIGVNLGDIIVEDGDIHGDGVNIAARLEGMADPGGICLSADAYRQVKGKLDVQFEDMGDQTAKNVVDPIRVYRVAATSPKTADASSSIEGRPFRDKPSIAVLPFTNMSGDTEQEYFSDGITEDIITELSRFSTLFVVARNSSFVFKGQSVDVTQVGEKLGVQYIVEGSVRRAGGRIRITAQLVETLSGKHIWAQRYDRNLGDIFELQDEVTKAIVGILPGRLDSAEAQCAARKAPGDMTAYDRFLRGLNEFGRGHALGAFDSPGTFRRARLHFQEAIDLDPGFARAHSYLALTGFCEFFYIFVGREVLTSSLHSVDKAILLDPDDTFAPAVRGLILIFLGREDEGVLELERTLEFNKNNAELLYWAGFVLSFSGHADKAVTYAKEAIHLNPLNNIYNLGLGFSLYLSGQFEASVKPFRKVVRTDWTWAQACLAAAYGQLGRTDEAQLHANQFATNVSKGLRERGEPVPDSAVAMYEQAWRDYLPRSEWVDSVLDGLRKAESN